LYKGIQNPFTDIVNTIASGNFKSKDKARILKKWSESVGPYETANNIEMLIELGLVPKNIENLMEEVEK
jgi:hypothetical protein